MGSWSGVAPSTSNQAISATTHPTGASRLGQGQGADSAQVMARPRGPVGGLENLARDQTQSFGDPRQETPELARVLHYFIS
jgi:hypothetical protein